MVSIELLSAFGCAIPPTGPMPVRTVNEHLGNNFASAELREDSVMGGGHGAGAPCWYGVGPLARNCFRQEIHPLQGCGIAAIQLVYWDQLQELDVASGGMVHKRDLTGGIGLECLTGVAIDFESVGGVGFETLDGVPDCGADGRDGLDPLARLVGRGGPGLDGDGYLGAGRGRHGECPVWLDSGEVLDFGGGGVYGEGVGVANSAITGGDAGGVGVEADFVELIAQGVTQAGAIEFGG